MRPIGQILDRTARKIGLRSGAQPLRYDVQLFQTLAGMRSWTPSDVVFDVGANDGRTILRLAKHLPVAPRIVAFEPVAATYDVLMEATRQLPNVEHHRLALSDRPGSRTMYLHELSALNSFDPAWGGTGETEIVRATTLDRFVEEQGIAKVHLLKIDAEGHDLAVLQGAEQSLAAGKIDVVQIEVSVGAPGRDQPTFEEVRLFLRRFEFYPYRICSQALGRLVLPSGDKAETRILNYCDALFVNGQQREGAGRRPVSQREAKEQAA